MGKLKWMNPIEEIHLKYLLSVNNKFPNYQENQHRKSINTKHRQMESKKS